MKIKLIILSIIMFNTAYSQWSTKPYADSGLYVCPGFDPGIVTFDDGSSVILGLLSSYIYAQKLDPEGYKVWPQPVLVFNNGSSDMVIGDNSERTWFCSDGDGGVILYWQDYRGAYYATDGPKNSTTHLQRVDKYGTVRWGTDGIKVNNLQDGYKRAQITSDGSGGCVLLWTEYGYNYPSSPNKNYSKLARYDANGNKLWQQALDSTFSGAIPISPISIIRSERNYFMKYYSSGNIQKSINDNGDLSLLKNMQEGGIYLSPMGGGFFYTGSNSLSRVTRFGDNTDTLWITELIINSLFEPIGCPLIPDGIGGIFITDLKRDTIIYCDSSGNVHLRKLEGVGSINYCFTDGKDGLITANSMTVRKYNSSGVMVWPDSVIYLYDSGNAYSKYFIPDNNGGFIVVYWSTIGGIFAQHTGRNGNLGIVTKVQDIARNTPASFELYQNYPNPFNPITRIRFAIKTKSHIKLTITDLLGRSITDLANKEVNAGVYEAEWNASYYSSGVYFYTLYINNKAVAVKKLLFTK